MFTAHKDAAGATILVRYPELTASDLNRQLEVQNACNIQTMKNCVLWLTVLSIISIAFSLISLVAVFS